jgi:hypothetical protein
MFSGLGIYRDVRFGILIGSFTHQSVAFWYLFVRCPARLAHRGVRNSPPHPSPHARTPSRLLLGALSPTPLQACLFLGWGALPPAVWLSRRWRQRPDPSQHRSEPWPRQTPLGQQEPGVSGMFHYGPTGLDPPLPHAGQRPVVDPLQQDQPPPPVPQLGDQHVQLSAHVMSAEPRTRQPCPVRRLLAFLDPWLRRPPPVVEPYDRPT